MQLLSSAAALYPIKEGVWDTEFGTVTFKQHELLLFCDCHDNCAVGMWTETTSSAIRSMMKKDMVVSKMFPFWAVYKLISNGLNFNFLLQFQKKVVISGSPFKLDNMWPNGSTFIFISEVLMKWSNLVILHRQLYVILGDFTKRWWAAGRHTQHTLTMCLCISHHDCIFRFYTGSFTGS